MIIDLSNPAEGDGGGRLREWFIFSLPSGDASSSAIISSSG
jgi:hypothetical protein